MCGLNQILFAPLKIINKQIYEKVSILQHI
jgi:hypothetical protein